MSQPPAAQPASSGDGGGAMMGFFMGLVVVIVALPAAIGALWGRRYMKTHQPMVAMAALTGAGFMALVIWSPLQDHLKASRTAMEREKRRDGIMGVVSAGAGAIPLLWLYTIPLAPALTMVWESVRPKSLAEQQADKDAQAQEKRTLQLESAKRRAMKASAASLTHRPITKDIDSATVLGAKIQGDPLFFANEHKRLMYLTTNIGAASLHMLFIGENGAGKSESMLRVAASIAASTNWDIFFVNPKNDTKMMQQFYDLMAFYDRRCRLFPQEAYNGWEGDSGALLSRIMAIPAYATEGAASFYSDMSEVYLRAVLNTDEALPSSFEELEERLQYGRLADQYKDNAQGFARVASISAADAKSVFMRFATMTPKLTQIRRDGWRLSEARAAYFGLPVLANERDSQSIAKFLLEDIKYYLSTRKPTDRRAVLIIDEFSSLGTESVIRLAEMARSLGGIVMLGTQTLAGLGDADQQARIVGNMTVVLHRMSAPEELTKLAGVQKVMTTIHQFQGKQILKRGTYRMEEEARIDPQDVRTLPTGCAWVIARGAAAKVQIAMMPAVPHVPIVIQRPRRAPTPAQAFAPVQQDSASFGATFTPMAEPHAPQPLIDHQDDAPAVQEEEAHAHDADERFSFGAGRVDPA
ncbi:TraM recognition domain-containing protein [Herpetosiphon gulosus]|uniref:AAA+ ATPase domain-containing protein n=1 Tax=Herpetosiphon gulosus TaxID=1973496 RepID=A0ABP9X870_9CHLR